MGEKQKAEELADEALEVAVEGDEAKARALADQARKLDPKAAEKVGNEAEADRQDASRYQKKQG